MNNTSNTAEKQRMTKEADFAFRQALAMCPTSPEVVFRYANLLIEQQRYEDSALVAETAAKLVPEDKQFRNLMDEVKRIQSSRRSVNSGDPTR